MRKVIYLFLISGLICSSLFSQQIDTDSLLYEGIKNLKAQKIETAIEQGRLGLKIAPEYSDFYMLLGRAFTKKKKTETALFYFNHVIQTAPNYRDAFTNSVNLYNESKNYEEALFTINKALEQYKGDKEFLLLKLKTLQLNDNRKELLNFLNEMVVTYPNDAKFQNALRTEKAKFNSDRIGISNSFSFFDRDAVGPWNLTSLQYVREREKVTVLGLINYTDRQSNGNSIIYGYQFELGAYIKTGLKGTSIMNLAYSPDLVFPELRLSYSYLYNFDTGWEIDGGIRYIKPNNHGEIYTAVAGVGKYIGSSWINLSSFLFFDNSDNYLSISGTYRYYFNTKYDYFGILLGYGSSPDESNNLINYNNQVSLDSYRVGAVFNKIIGNKVILGLQLIGNRQEYIKDKTQNQFDIFISLQYKL